MSFLPNSLPWRWLARNSALAFVLVVATSVYAQPPSDWKKNETKEGYTFYTPTKLKRSNYDVEDDAFQFHGDLYTGSHETGGSKFTFMVLSMEVQDGEGDILRMNEEDGHTILTALANMVARTLDIEVQVDEKVAKGGYVLQTFNWNDTDDSLFRYQAYLQIGTGKAFLAMGICGKEGNRDRRVFENFFNEVEFPN